MTGWRVLAPCSEADMVAEWLRSEWSSPRFAPAIGAALEREGLDSTLVTEPNLTDEAANAARRRVLQGYRGDYLRGFPRAITWHRVALTPDEMLRVETIDWSYWLELTGGSRHPRDAAARVRSGARAYDVPNDGFLTLAERVREGERFPPLILATTGEHGARVVVIEGHARLIAYALAAEALAAEIEAILGTAPSVVAWGCY